MRPSAEEIGIGLAAVAQALINISEGLVTIEKGSPLFRHMELLMHPANAAAMKASPELLDALKGLAVTKPGVPGCWCEVGVPCSALACSAARAAIAKAEGGDS